MLKAGSKDIATLQVEQYSSLVLQACFCCFFELCILLHYLQRLQAWNNKVFFVLIFLEAIIIVRFWFHPCIPWSDCSFYLSNTHSVTHTDLHVDTHTCTMSSCILCVYMCACVFELYLRNMCINSNQPRFYWSCFFLHCQVVVASNSWVLFLYRIGWIRSPQE